MEDALKVQEKLDGFSIYNYRIRVLLVTHQLQHKYWRKTDSSPEKEDIGKLPCGLELQVLKTENVNKMSHGEGLKDESIMSIFGFAFSFMFKDQEMMLKSKTEYATSFQRCFKEVSEWSEDMLVYNRQAMITCQGILMHA
ncbi:hypothetical protein V6N13_115998 [Hibiscus sabdariffa]|uniref:Uncharacterized protein n=1 Tax=Hibiscus sabdariffa TaxID=183260 RepID=A0ABR2QSP8_9ROSI